MNFLPNIEFAEKVKQILNKESSIIAKGTDDEVDYYETIGDLIVKAHKELVE